MPQARREGAVARLLQVSTEMFITGRLIVLVRNQHGVGATVNSIKIQDPSHDEELIFFSRQF